MVGFCSSSRRSRIGPGRAILGWLGCDRDVRKNVEEGFPSGQRDQTVNLTAMPSQVRILPPPTLGGRDSALEIMVTALFLVSSF